MCELVRDERWHLVRNGRMAPRPRARDVARIRHMTVEDFSEVAGRAGSTAWIQVTGVDEAGRTDGLSVHRDRHHDEHALVVVDVARHPEKGCVASVDLGI